MYSINGVPLDNPALGWRFRAPSKPLSGIVKQLQTVRARRDGLVRLPSEYDAVSITLVVKTARARLVDLYALMASPRLLLSLTAQPGRDAEVELVTATPMGRGDGEEIVDASFVLRIPAAFWRSIEVTTAAVSLSAASVTVKSLNADGGLSAPVGDAVIRVKGAVTALQVTDAGSGAWFTFQSVAADRWLRFEAATGRAFLTSTDTWSGGTEVSGDVDFGGPRGTFEITPYFPNTLDPTVREGRLTVATTTRTSASIQVRARSAHLL